MNDEEGQQLIMGDVVALQADMDIALEIGVVIDTGTTKVMIMGDDPEMGRFYAPFPFSKIVRIIRKSGGTAAPEESKLSAAVREFVKETAEMLAA